MTRRPLRNVSASVRTRLLNRSREKDEDFQFLLQRYAAERFLHRLGESEHRSRLVLKGAMLLALWGESTYRPTRDLDFTGHGDSRQGSVRRAIRAICSVPVVDDGIVFDAETIYSIARHVSFTGERLAGSISTTFDRRHTAISPDLPQSLTPQFYAEPARADQWRAYLFRSSLPGVPDDFRIVGGLIQSFLVGPWRALAQDTAITGAWFAGGPWSYDAASPRLTNVLG